MILSDFQVTWPDFGQFVKPEKSCNSLSNIASKRKLVKVLVFLASLSIACSISAVKGGFLQTGLARVLLSPSRVVWINGELVGEAIPATECAHASPLTASSTVDLEAFVSPKC